MIGQCVDCDEDGYVELDGEALCEDCFDDRLRQRGIRS